MRIDLHWESGVVTGAWDRPDADPEATLVLAHGAGGDLDDPVLAEVAKGCASRSIETLRFNFPYRQSGRRAPGPQKHSEGCYRAVASYARREDVPLFIGGKSYGGRIASHIAAKGFETAGLVYLSYPLHPPGKPELLRDAHLRDIDAPMLFCQGTKDSFAQAPLLARVISSLTGARLLEVRDADHGLRVRGRTREDVTNEIADAIASFVNAES